MQARRKTAYHTIEASDILLPEPAGRARRHLDNPRQQSIEDAVFEVVGPSAIRQKLNDNPPPRQRSMAPEILPWTTRITVIAVAMIERQLLKLSIPSFSSILVGTFFVVFWLCGGFAALNSDPIAPSLQPIPFVVSRVSVASEDANGMKILSVTGTLTNGDVIARPVPPLSVISGDRKTTFGTIVLPADEIGPNVNLRFSGRFKLAGGKLADIIIIPLVR